MIAGLNIELTYDFLAIEEFHPVVQQQPVKGSQLDTTFTLPGFNNMNHFAFSGLPNDIAGSELVTCEEAMNNREIK